VQLRADAMVRPKVDVKKYELLRLKGSPSLKWIFAASGFLLLFLYGLSMTDFSNRRGWPPTQVLSEPLREADQDAH